MKKLMNIASSFCRSSTESWLPFTLVVLLLFVNPGASGAEPANTAEKIARQIVEYLSAGSGLEGRVVMARNSRELVVQFEDRPARLDQEFLLMRPANESDRTLAQVIGTVRVKAVHDNLTRVSSLWAETPPQVNDVVAYPTRLTLFLAPIHDLAQNPIASPALVEQALELALSKAPQLRVVPISKDIKRAELIEDLQAAGELGFILEPVLLPGETQVTLTVKLRSVLSGQTLASYADALELRPGSGQVAELQDEASAKNSGLYPRASGLPSSGAITSTPASPDIVIAKRTPEFEGIVNALEQGGPVREALSESLLSIAPADIDGDGRTELVGISTAGVYAYKLTRQGLVQVSQYQETQDKFVNYIAVDAADVNDNGKDEIFVTAITSISVGREIRNKLRSLVFEFGSQALQPIAKDLPYFLRVAKIPGETASPPLLAQKMGTHEPFSGPLIRMVNKGRYYSASEMIRPLPEDVSGLYNFSILEVREDELDTFASVSSDRQLQVFKAGRLVWEGLQDLGLVDHVGFLQTPHFSMPRYSLSDHSRARDLAVRKGLPRRILVGPSLIGTGRLEMVTVKNETRFGFTLFNSSAKAASVVAYVKLGEQFAKNWETTPVEGKARDLAIADFNDDGEQDLALLSAIKDNAALHFFLHRSGKGFSRAD